MKFEFTLGLGCSSGIMRDDFIKFIKEILGSDNITLDLGLAVMKEPYRYLNKRT